METALALAGPLLALAREQEEQEDQLDLRSGAEGQPLAAGPGAAHGDEAGDGDEVEAEGESSPCAAAPDRRALLRRRLCALGDDEAHSLARLLEARLLAPPPLPTTASPDDQQGEDLHDPSQAPQQQQQPQLPAATDLLPMLLAAPRTALPAIGACVGLVAQGRLAGRQAVLCVSAIREALSTELAVAVVVGGDESEDGHDDEEEDEGGLEPQEGDGVKDGAAGCRRRRRRRSSGEQRQHHHHHSRPQIPTEAQLRRRAELLAELRVLLFAAVDALLPAPAEGEEGKDKGDRRLRLRLAEAGPGRLNDLALVIDVLWPLLVLAQRLEDALRLWAAAAARWRQQQQQQQQLKARRRSSSGAADGLLGGTEVEGGDNGSSSNSSQGGACEPPAVSIGEEVAAAVVARPWPAPLTLPLLGLCRDMHEFLAEEEAAVMVGMDGAEAPIPATTATWALVRRQIGRNACPRPPVAPPAAGCGKQACDAAASAEAARAAADRLLTSDGAGLMRQCLLLAEAHARRAAAAAAAASTSSTLAAGGSGNGGAAARRAPVVARAPTTTPSSGVNPWLSLFRRLYHATPPAALATTELVLEQCLRQALPCVGLLARDLELRLRQESPQLSGKSPAGGGGADADTEAEDADVCWRDVALLLLLRRTVASWPLSSLLASAAAVGAGGGAGGRRRAQRGNGPLDLVCSHRLLDGLLLALLLRLAARAAAASAAAAAVASGPGPAAAATSKLQQAVAPPSLPRLLAGVRRAVEAVVTHGAAGGLAGDDDDGPYHHQYHHEQQRRRLCLGRLPLQRSAQLFEAGLAWLRDAERARLDLDRQFPASFPPSALLTAAELRALAAAAISALYGAAPEGQARVLGALLGAIVEHSAGQPEQQLPQASAATGAAAGADAADYHAAPALSPAGAGLVHALGCITAEWPASLRQHTGVFQHLVAQLPTLPSPLACAVVRASAPLAAACPAYLDALLAVVRKCIVRADVSGRAFGMAALTALLAVSSSEPGRGGGVGGGGGGMGMGLLARADRGEEVAAMFESLLGLALPLPLKARLYRAIADAAATASAGACYGAPARGGFGGRLALGGFSSSSSAGAAGRASGMVVAGGTGGGAAVALLRASMGRRLARFVDRGTGRLSPLSLFEEVRRGSAGGSNGGDAPSHAASGASASSSVALRDDLPELLRCVLSLNDHGRPHHHPRGAQNPKAPAPLSVRLARLVLGVGAEEEEEVVDPDAAWARRALDGVVAFLRDGAPMEGEGAGGGHVGEDGDDEGLEFGGYGYGGPRRRRRRNGSVLPPCCPDSVSAGEKLHLLLALLEALLDAALGPCAVVVGAAPHHDHDHGHDPDLAYTAAMELYRLHGMLSDMAEALGVKPRAQRPALDGVERGAPLLRLGGAAAFLRLAWARVAAARACKKGAVMVVGGAGADDDGDVGEEEAAAVVGMGCAACGEARRRFALWAVQHAALSCQRALEAARPSAAAAVGGEGEEQLLPVDGAASASASASAAAAAETPAVDAAPAVDVSPAALLPVLLDLYACVPTAFAGPGDAAAMNKAKAEGAAPENADDPTGGSCPQCQAVQRAAALKQQAAALAAAPANGATVSSSSKLRRQAPALAARAAWQRTAAALPLSAAFLAGVDGKARRLVEEEVAASAADPDAAVLEARVALLDLIRAVVARLGASGGHHVGSVPPPPGAAEAPPAAAADAAAAGAGLGRLLPFVDTLAGELGAGLADDAGMPLRLVQAYLDLLEALVARLPPCPTPHRGGKGHSSSSSYGNGNGGGDALGVIEAYAAWRLALARRLLLPLTRARVAQAPVLRRFVRLALAAAPAAGTVALTDGVMAAGARYLGEWLREARNAYLRRRRSGGGGKGDEEVVTAAEARELLEEEGDGELYPDGEHSGGEEEEEEDVDPATADGAAADGAAEGASETAAGGPGKAGAGTQRHDDDGDEEEEEEEEGRQHGGDSGDKATSKALTAELGRMRFASAACWQAAVLPVLTRWEQLLLLQSPLALDGKGFSALLGHLPTFLRPLDVGGQSTVYGTASSSSSSSSSISMPLATALLRSGSATTGCKKKNKTGKDHKQLRVAAFFLPGPLKLRLLSLFSRLFALARPAAARVARRLRRLQRRAAAEEDGDEDDAEEEEEGGPRPAAWDADAALVGAYLPLATDLSVAVQAWAAAERQQRGGAGAALRKRLPSVLFALERVDLAVQRLAQQSAEHAAALGADWLLPVEEEGGKKGRKGKGAKGKGAVERERAALCPLAARLVRWHHERRRWEEEMEKENRAPASSSHRRRHGAAADEGGSSDSGSGSSSEEEDDDGDDYDLALLTMGGGGRGGGRGHKRKRGRRLRSRNVVVDRWLAEEGEGDDAFADLEDFIMEDEYT